ncbi:MAG: metallophosphoesterase [Clostridia bacterium]|nr:metallophosphoesterase [Clostridia bacterium]
MAIMTMLDGVFGAIAGVFMKLMSVVLSLMVSAGSMAAAPATDDPIKATDEENVQLIVEVLADTQLNAFNTNSAYLDLAMQDYQNAETDLEGLLILGDVTENSLECEWNRISEIFNANGFDDTLLLATGNHDIRLRDMEQIKDRFYGLQNEFTVVEPEGELNYSYELNGYTFIVMGSDTSEMEEANIGDEQLAWLDATMSEATADGKPVFVILHQVLANTHGLPYTWGNGSNKTAGSVGEDSDAIYNVLNKYENVILLTGHLHTGFGQYTYETLGDNGNITSINFPGLGKDCIQGIEGYGQGAIMEVYEDQVIIRARDVSNGAYYGAEYDLTIDLK